MNDLDQMKNFINNLDSAMINVNHETNNHELFNESYKIKDVHNHNIF